MVEVVQDEDSQERDEQVGPGRSGGAGRGRVFYLIQRLSIVCVLARVAG